MGFNTTVVVLNDALHAIAEDKDFGKNLSDVILGFSRQGSINFVPAQNHANAAHVIETHHADSMHLVGIGGNIGYDFGRMGNYRSKEEEMFHAWAEKLGFVVYRKRKTL